MTRFDQIQCPRKEKNECRFRETSGMSTAMYYPPIYDARGVNLNPDMNSTSFSVSCSVCGRAWLAVLRGGITTYTENKGTQAA